MTKNENYRKISEAIIKFLRIEFKKRGKSKAIVGISGGIDSAITAFLCKKANLDLYALLLPYKKRGLEEAKEVVVTLGLPKKRIIYIDISSLVDSQIKTINKAIRLDKISTGNILPRQRMILQYAVASNVGGIVVGAQNLSEYILGYFTQYGDQTCDICPLAGLWKTQIYQLAKFLKVPKSIIRKKPHGDIWPGLTDEKDMGFKYKDADQIMHLFFVNRYSKERIVSEFRFDNELVKKVLNRAKITNYKRINAPKWF
ncbi:MAG: NAD(+) synthase [Candidatus Portnoybacteria bacterium CG06_land_8_20_14_3_00_39_12]|uniref:NH(3)-dependent NAD(+) synthetase n=1 Tax=Candidatus Portnoybacteria bacterium CG06_land_8_20_14_3_00_39_12 TaxID=1974809 RepID=A0A2M7AXW7_9BACT|nr:MAG: NAD(+) synthase [Candidatus Portnoybacteria bacterium CG06_land_8_20_14_3_00_39_12]